MLDCCKSLNYYAFAAVALILSVGVSAQTYTNVGITEGYQLWQSGVLVLDVRTPAEFEAGHLPDAYNIDVNTLSSRLDELAGLENSEMLVYCQRGGRSANASSILASEGFTAVYNMLGGFEAWYAAGYDVETGSGGCTAVTLEEGYQMWLDGVFVLDVRPGFEYTLGHIPDAMNINSAHLEEQLYVLDGLQDSDILVYCSSEGCGRTGQACTILTENGFNQVYTLPAGYSAWRDAGYDVETGGDADPIQCNAGALVATDSTGGPGSGFMVMLLAAAAASWMAALRIRRA